MDQTQKETVLSVHLMTEVHRIREDLVSCLYHLGCTILTIPIRIRTSTILGRVLISSINTTTARPLMLEQEGGQIYWRPVGLIQETLEIGN